MKKSTLKRSHLSVRHVSKDSNLGIIYQDMSLYIQEKNHSNVIFAQNAINNQMTLKFILDVIQVKSIFSVNPVKKNLVNHQV